MEDTRGFSLIELLIVVAIISIITAVVVPNLMSANIRAKVSGAKADMGSIAIALEDYKVDYGEYPKDSRFSRSGSYASDIIAESNQAFDGKSGSDDGNDAIGLGYLIYPKAGFEPTYLKQIAGDPFNNSGEKSWKFFFWLDWVLMVWMTIKTAIQTKKTEEKPSSAASLIS
jgi:prepilin-type N-terminal cleavage/methylation domain-containing protein